MPWFLRLQITTEGIALAATITRDVHFSEHSLLPYHKVNAGAKLPKAQLVPMCRDQPANDREC